MCQSDAVSQSADDEAPRPPSSGRRLWVVLVAAVLVAILASAAGIFRDFDAERRDRSSAAIRAGIGALVGLAIAALIVALVARHRRRRGLAAGALGGALLAALAALLVAAGASLGASTAPPEDTSPPRTSESSDSDGQGGETEVQPNSGAIDAETGEMYLDTNGDGKLDVTLVACPPVRRPTETIDEDASTTSTTIPPYRVGDKVRVAIDNECDGIIDRYVYLEVFPTVNLPGRIPDFPRDGQTPSDDDGGSSDDSSSSSDFGKVMLWLLILAAVGALVAGVIAVARGWRPGRSKAPIDLPPPPWPEDPGIDEEAAADTMAASGRMLVDDPDPRTAIIAAYATLLEGLEAAGAGRLPHEAPEEHLQRSLRKLGIPPAPLSEVTRLFLVARFSTHPVTEADRAAARTALSQAEQHLRALLEARR